MGGTGLEGRGLALRFAMAGETVMIGSRDRFRAIETAQELTEKGSGITVSGSVNEEVACQTDPVFLVVPYVVQREMLISMRGLLDGKIVVDVVVPLMMRKKIVEVISVPEGSAALQAKMLLPKARVVAAFQTISSHHLLKITSSLESDVMICSDDKNAKALVVNLVSRIQGLRAVDGGKLENARYVENLTALLLNINRLYNANSSIRILGI